MKKLLILFISGLMFMTSCKDENKAPIITFDQAGKGAYVKLLQVNEGANGYNLSQYSTSTYDFDVEFVDEQQGDLVATYTIFVSYQPSPFSSTSAVPEQLYLTADASEFGESERGFKSFNVRIPLAELAPQLGLSEDDLGGADIFNFRSEIVLTDGSVFKFENSSSAINSSAFAGHFNFSVGLTCPLADSDFSGAYTLTHVSGSFPFGLFTFNGTETSEVQLEVVSGLRRKFKYRYIDGIFGADPSPEVEFEFEIICSIIVPDDGQTTSVGCGTAILVGAKDGAFGVVDVADDSSFMIDLNDFDGGGTCGNAPDLVRIRLDKL